MKHVAGLDGLRAVAVVAVVAFHAGDSPFAAGGFLGVDVFFVLSGFLITTLLSREFDPTGTIALGNFYLRRFLRLMPALSLLIVAYLALAPLLWPEYGRFEHARDALVGFAYLSDYGYAIWKVPEYLRHTWSLSVEEHFYLVWPLLLPTILRAKRPDKIALLLYLVAALWRLANFGIADWTLAYYRFDTRIAGILLGCCLALWLRERDRAGLPTVLPVSPDLPAAALVASLMLQAWKVPSAYQFAMPLTEVATAALILAIVRPGAKGSDWVLRCLEWRHAVTIGTLSYGIYLWHFPIALLTRHSLPYAQSLLICLAFSTCLAWLSYHSVEAFGRRLRKRFELRLAPG